MRSRMNEASHIAFRYKRRIITSILMVLAACSVSATYAGPRHELRPLLRLRHREYASYVTTGPEASELVLQHRLMFHPGDISKVRRILDATLTKRRGWAISVVTPGQLITYDRLHVSVEYLSTAQYNLYERGINNPAWYRNGKLAPKAYRGGCVVQYFTTKR